MSLTLQQMKANSMKRLEEIRVASQKINSYDRPDEFKPTVDDKGTGYAYIRFLPACKTETAEWVKYYNHAFKNQENGQWYIENCRTTLGNGEKDPVTELNSRLYKTGNDEDKKQGSAQKRKLHYVSNILVLDDPKKPENNGKVFKYVYGAKIFDKIQAKLNPQFPGEQIVNPFNFWEGANFRLKICKKDGQRNYDMSEFDSPSPVYTDDAKIEALWNECHPLQPLIAPDQFKPYEELQKQLERVLGTLTGVDGNVPVLTPTDESSASTAITSPQRLSSTTKPASKPTFDEDVPESVTASTRQSPPLSQPKTTTTAESDMELFKQFANG